MAQRLAKHGSEAGYKAENNAGNICNRCRNAHRVYARQFRPKGRAQGLKFGTYDVIDHLYTQNPPERGNYQSHPKQTSEPLRSTESTTDVGFTLTAEPSAREPEPSSQHDSGPSLTDRLTDAMRNMRVSGSNDYIDSDAPPDYLHSVDPDPEPDGDWSEVRQDDFVINKAGMELIEDNLGTYLSVIGITMEMVDPYCGPILAENLDNMVSRWTKVIARYPRAASLFMSKDGGTLMLWIGALQSTWPVLLAIYQHHLSHEIQTDKGRVFRVRQSANGDRDTVDATMPPMPEYDYNVG